FVIQIHVLGGVAFVAIDVLFSLFNRDRVPFGLRSISASVRIACPVFRADARLRERRICRKQHRECCHEKRCTEFQSFHQEPHPTKKSLPEGWYCNRLEYRGAKYPRSVWLWQAKMSYV